MPRAHDTDACDISMFTGRRATPSRRGAGSRSWHGSAARTRLLNSFRTALPFAASFPQTGFDSIERLREKAR